MTQHSTVVLLDPSAEDLAEEHNLAARLHSLSGKTVGLVDNTKHNSDLFLEQLGELLRENAGVSRVVPLRKANASTPLPPELLDKLIAECDAVVHGVAD